MPDIAAVLSGLTLGFLAGLLTRYPHRRERFCRRCGTTLRCACPPKPGGTLTPRS